MVTNISASNFFVVSSYAFSNLNSSTVPSLFLSINPRRTRRRTQLRLQSLSFDLLGPKEKDPLRFCGIRKGDCRRRVCFGFVRMCKGREEEGDLGLEGEILEFMQKSSKPEAFPTKKELVDAGRMDLVEAILKQGGWLSLGWDLDDNDEAEESLQGDEIANWNSVIGKEFDNGGFQQRDDIGQGNSTLDGHEIRGFGIDSFENNSYPSASSSGRSLDIGAEDESGVEGILSRLEKQRDILFGLDLREKGVGPRNSIDGGDDWQHESLFDAAVARHDRSSRHPSSSHTRGILNDKLSLKPQNIKSSGFDGLRNSLEPETWRTWTMQRAGYSNTEFEAAEIAFNRSREGPSNASKDETFEISEGNTEPLDRRKELNSSGEDINHNYIKTRLQHMELELASALHSFRSKSDKFNTQKDHEMPSEDFRTLSDAWEFQENDIMNAKDRLRSIRAKLAVIEGKMALAIIDTQKIVEEKQKRIDAAHRALRILHTACIVWPNSASEVLLTGSFDGWATQRKMKRSSTGVFSLCLKLYPGRYEIKFIVDGIWRIDPLRPIVHSHGYENNLLIIT